MSKTKTVRDPLVRHSQLRVLIDHISTLIAALDVRLGECEKVRPVDPGVKDAADAMLADVRAVGVIGRYKPKIPKRSGV